MGSSRPAAGGGRWVEVDPARLPHWLDGFRERHGDLAVNPVRERPAEPSADPVRERPAEPSADPAVAYPVRERLVVAAFDGAVAELHPPPGALGGADLAAFVADAQATRRLGLVLARQAAAAVGVALAGELEVSKVDSWYVQGRTAAGGQSQQRFARRRGNQAAAAAGKAADIVARLLLPAAGSLSAVVTGGDRRTIDTILSDPRLAPLVSLRAERHLPVPTPNLAVLRDAVRSARAVAIRYADLGVVVGNTGDVSG